jgi:hypothetical protein
MPHQNAEMAARRGPGDELLLLVYIIAVTGPDSGVTGHCIFSNWQPVDSTWPRSDTRWAGPEKRTPLTRSLRRGTLQRLVDGSKTAAEPQLSVEKQSFCVVDLRLR